MFRWWRSRADREKDRQAELFGLLLEVEQKRLEAQLRADQQRAELELKRLQIEVDNAEILQKTRAEDARLRLELKQQQREQAAAARQAKREKAEREKAAGAHGGPDGACRVCINDKDPTLTVEEITWHYNGHRSQQSLFPH